jgi:Na+/proline symporter
VAAVIAFTPRWFLYLFFLLILCGLISTVDSILCAVSSIAGHDIIKRLESATGYEFNEVVIARIAMVIVSALAVCVANIPGMTILYLFLFYGTLRSSVMLPTIFAINGYKMSERGLFYGIIASLCIGLPMFAIGNLNGYVPMIVAGSLLTIGLSGAFSLLLGNKTGVHPSKQ